MCRSGSTSREGGRPRASGRTGCSHARRRAGARRPRRAAAGTRVSPPNRPICSCTAVLVPLFVDVRAGVCGGERVGGDAVAVTDRAGTSEAMPPDGSPGVTSSGWTGTPSLVTFGLAGEHDRGADGRGARAAEPVVEHDRGSGVALLRRGGTATGTGRRRCPDEKPHIGTWLPSAVKICPFLAVSVKTRSWAVPGVTTPWSQTRPSEGPGVRRRSSGGWRGRRASPLRPLPRRAGSRASGR